MQFLAFVESPYLWYNDYSWIVAGSPQLVWPTPQRSRSGSWNLTCIRLPHPFSGKLCVGIGLWSLERFCSPDARAVAYYWKLVPKEHPRFSRHALWKGGLKYVSKSTDYISYDYPCLGPY